jgi:hypothetical protein
MNFQYPKFGSGAVQRPVAVSRRPVRIRSPSLGQGAGRGACRSFVTLDSGGGVRVERGFVRLEDERQAKAAKKQASKSAEDGFD